MAARVLINRSAIFALAVLGASVFWASAALPASAYNYNRGSYGSGAYNVGQLDSTTTVLISNHNPATVGASITLTATVTPSSASGSFTFKDGGSSIGTATIGHGSGALVTSSLTTGSHSLTAIYGGDSFYLTSSSSILTQTMNAIPSSSSSSSSSAQSVSVGGSRGGLTPGSYSVNLGSHNYSTSSSPPSSGSSSTPASIFPVTADTQRMVARVCARLPHRHFTAFTIQRINERLLKRFGMSCQ